MKTSKVIKLYVRNLALLLIPAIVAAAAGLLYLVDGRFGKPGLIIALIVMWPIPGMLVDILVFKSGGNDDE